MGTLIGHVAPGIGFLLVGLWHLFNHIKLFSLHPKSYVAPPWFPAPRFRHLELVLIIVGSLASIATELFLGPAAHQPFDPADGTIPSYHLQNFEHAAISLAFLIYAAFAIHIDRTCTPTAAAAAMTQLIGSAAFAQQLLLFHLHSADHVGVEGQYHWLLQLVITVSLATALLGITAPRSFAVSFVRSASITFQGVWFVVMGFMLWTPRLISKRCFMNYEVGHTVVRCRSEEALLRAKALVNLQFSWYMSGVIVFSMLVYFYLSKKYPEEPEYVPILANGEEEEDVEIQKVGVGGFRVGKGIKAIELDR